MSRDGVSSQKKTYHAKVASPGPTTVTGPAQIIEINRSNQDRYPKSSEITGLESINSGDILITPDVYPNMIEKIRRCSGLIVYNEDRVTGRGPVLARELELPAVIDCPEISSEVQSGDRVTVDATEGQVIRHRT